jgi:hypothetical protein
MQKTKPENPDRPRHADIQRDSMEDIREIQSSPRSGEIQYRAPNRDRTLGEADRTGRHFDEEHSNEEPGQEEEAEAPETSEDHQVD